LNETANASFLRVPIRFGDQICFISRKNELALAMGKNGKSATVASLKISPEIKFTIVSLATKSSLPKGPTRPRKPPKETLE
jgi:hypothetical protein